VSAVVGGIPATALSRGVYTEQSLRERFSRVETVARRVGAIGDDGGSLLRPVLFCFWSPVMLRNSVAYPDPGSGAFSTPGSGAFFDTGIWDGVFPGIPDPKPIFCSCWIREIRDPRSGINIPDPQHCLEIWWRISTLLSTLQSFILVIHY
jgi:hypothetical protein